MSKNKEGNLKLVLLINGDQYFTLYCSDPKISVDFEEEPIELILEGELVDFIGEEFEVLTVEAKYKTRDLIEMELLSEVDDSEYYLLSHSSLWVEKVYSTEENPLLLQIVTNTLNKIISNMNKAPNE